MSHKRTRRVYDDALTYEKVYAAWDTVSHTCKNKRGLFEFGMFAHARVAKILEELKARDYWPNMYRCFMIFEPKPRLVMSQSIRDKVVNHFVAREYLLPLLEDSLIDTNVATRKEMGSKHANRMLLRYLAQMQAARPGAKIYALKVDVSKYFYSIDHERLMEILRRKIKDPDVIEILQRIMDETDKPYINMVIDRFNLFYGTEIPHYETGKGLSIGAMTSQFLAIFYLNDVDHYIKEKMKRKYFIRYMDDFLVLGYDKKELRGVREEIAAKLTEMKLAVNPKSAIYNLMDGGGVGFLGYRYYIDKHGRVRVKCLSKTVRRVKHRLKTLALYNPEEELRSYQAYRGYFKHTLPCAGIEQGIEEFQEGLVEE